MFSNNRSPTSQCITLTQVKPLPSSVVGHEDCCLWSRLTEQRLKPVGNGIKLSKRDEEEDGEEEEEEEEKEEEKGENEEEGSNSA